MLQRAPLLPVYERKDYQEYMSLTQAYASSTFAVVVRYAAWMVGESGSLPPWQYVSRGVHHERILYWPDTLLSPSRFVVFGGNRGNHRVWC